MAVRPKVQIAALEAPASAAAAMGRLERNAYTPNPAHTEAYSVLYEDYTALHDHFGRGGSDVMRRLKALRRNARSTQEVSA